MARRNLFQPPPPPDASPAKDAKTRFPSTGAMSGVRSTLKDLSSNAVRDIPVDMIEDSGPRDRLSFGDAEVASLAESIRAHGQQVPIMVRPLTDKPGRFHIVYGRRRLRALRLLDQPAKALVRSLSDEAAILAQGQENAQRLDPSFIEKALFAAELVDGGYEQAVILDALAIDKPMLSRMSKIVRSVPVTVIQAIGSAHGIGRRRWEDLADRTRGAGLDLDGLLDGLDLTAAATSDDRFALLADAVTAALAQPVTRSAPPALSVLSADGTRLAEIKETPRALTLKMSKSDAPEFTRWMRENAEAELKRLYEAWQADNSAD
ncbi:plasmid partitioning protein RepB [Marinibacterium sp. SX1]|uniref:plasmid partitioning protein RepB n=1 Tax=Marinibacterium sp. SX1 TaxID=3388424 RepID=UPI003D16CF45